MSGSAKKSASMDGNAFGILREDGKVSFLANASSDLLYPLMACAEDDATSWNDFVLLWPRSVSSKNVPSSIEQLPWESLSPDQLASKLKGREDWIVVDLPAACVLSGKRAPKFTLPSEYSKDDETASMELEIGPWWRIEQRLDPADVAAKKRKPPSRVLPNREVLWGDEWITFFANELVSHAKSGKKMIRGNAHKTVRDIHKKWLMTPRPSLGGKTPREQLHIAKDWISCLESTQRFRNELGMPSVPLPRSFSGYASAPLGKNEVIMYFDGCRDILAHGWTWLSENHEEKNEHADLVVRLRSILSQRFEAWRSEIDEEGVTPAFAIQMERDRVPLQMTNSGHQAACDCPICELVAQGRGFGPGILYYDGHQLELDDEFAFSLYPTHEEWVEEVGAFDDEEEEFDEDGEDDEDGAMFEEDDDYDDEEEDEDASVDSLESPWKESKFGENPLPGESGQQLEFAFQVTELILEMSELAKKSSSPPLQLQNVVRSVQLFNKELETRNSKENLETAASSFKQSLESAGTSHPSLLPRTSDLQSRVDSVLREAFKNL